MKTVLGLYPILCRLHEAARISVPEELVLSWSAKFSPEALNGIIFEYKIWKFICGLDNHCKGCGAHLPLGSRSTSQTCSNRCHKLVIRSNIPPLTKLKEEAASKATILEELAQPVASQKDVDLYPWHRVTDGLKISSRLPYVLHN